MHFLRRLFESQDTAEIHERLEKLEKTIRNLEVEWTEVYNKFRTLQMRVAKQVQRLDANSSQEEPQGAEGEEINQPSGLGLSSLSPRQRQIQREIMARRQKHGLQTEGGE
jgi:DNA anti-recombination protein RmuC